MAARDQLNDSQVAPLITALVRESSPDTLRTLLQAVVRLPLPAEGWIGVAAKVFHLLESGVFAFVHDGDPPMLPLGDVIEVAAFVPVRQIREALQGILALEHSDARKAAAKALALARDPSGVRELLHQLSEGYRDERYEVAKLLYRFGDRIKPFALELHRLFQEEKEEDIQLLLALSLVTVGESAALETLLCDVRHDQRYLLERLVDLAECELVKPVPAAIVPLLERIQNSHDQENGIRDLALRLVDLSRPADRKEEADFRYSDGDQSSSVSRQIESALRDVVASYQGEPIAEFAIRLMDVMNQEQERFSTDVNTLVRYYREARAFCAVRKVWMVLAWALSRAPLAAVVELVALWLDADDPEERGEAATLLYFVAHYRTTSEASYFGEGGGCGGVDDRPGEFVVEPEATLDFGAFGLTARGTPPGYVGSGDSWNESVALPSVHLGAAAQEAAKPVDRFVAALESYLEEQDEKAREYLARRSPLSVPQLGMKDCRFRLGTTVTIMPEVEHL
jgi:hypothetical protein